MISRPLVIVGTRPEAIKLTPVILELISKENMSPSILCTGQHGAVVQDILLFFGIENATFLGEFRAPDLAKRYAEMLSRIDAYINELRPDSIIVQGDTLSAYCGAMAGFLNKLPVVHIEAGLRTNDAYSPFPEEMNRRLIARLAHWHFAPTDAAFQALKAEGITDRVYNVGNTAVDAIERAAAILDFENWETIMTEKHAALFAGGPKVLVTIHRRENWENDAIENALSALDSYYEDTGVSAIFCLHPNPVLSEHIHKLAKDRPNITFCDALPYPDFVWAMKGCQLILTDSGGIQEEAPSLQKPVCVLRDVTERKEGIDLDMARLVGTDKENIYSGLIALSNTSIEKSNNPYGDGRAAKRIMDTITR